MKNEGRKRRTIPEKICREQAKSPKTRPIPDRLYPRLYHQHSLSLSDFFFLVCVCSCNLFSVFAFEEAQVIRLKIHLRCLFLSASCAPLLLLLLLWCYLLHPHSIYLALNGLRVWKITADYSNRWIVNGRLDESSRPCEYSLKAQLSFHVLFAWWFWVVLGLQAQ